MKSSLRKLLLVLLLGFLSAPASAVTLPDPANDVDLSPNGIRTQDSIVLAGGCFWGMQAVFQHLSGVTKVVAGYAGGNQYDAKYEFVSEGTTGHAESVAITYDMSQLTLGHILKVFFAIAHDPTQLNYQGPDHGNQYRSAIFYRNAEQQKFAADYIAQLNAAGVFSKPIVTTLEALPAFYPAEEFHQDFLKKHPKNPYIVANDLPKLMALEKEFPYLYVK